MAEKNDNYGSKNGSRPGYYGSKNNNYNRNNNRKGNGNKGSRGTKNKIEKVNPYTFVPFSKRVVRRNIEEYLNDNKEKLITGRIDCVLKTKSPLAIPDKIKNKNDEHKSYYFYEVGGIPIIPGSSIRGCMRNIFETVTESCVSKIDEGKLTDGKNTSATRNKKMKSIMGKHSVCVRKENVCSTCALFGLTGERAMGSRVRFTDAVMELGKPLEEMTHKNITLKELASPQVSAVKLYTKKPDDSAKSWSYGYYTDAEKNKHFFEVNAEFLNGRKYYWHHKFDINGSKRVKRNKRNATMDLIKENAEFRYSVFFDGITEEELNKLLWAISLGDNDNEIYCQKIGHGKPLGLGSVNNRVEKVIVKKKSYDLNSDYVEWNVSEIKDRISSIEEKLDSKSVLELKKITNLNAKKGELVSY